MRPFDEGFGPDCLYLDDIRPQPRVDLSNLAPIKQSAFIVSGAMMDVLSGFDLGETQLIQLPFYNQKGRPRAEPAVPRARVFNVRCV